MENRENKRKEKRGNKPLKLFLSLIIISLALIYISLFFIHYIVDDGLLPGKLETDVIIEDGAGDGKGDGKGGQGGEGEVIDYSARVLVYDADAEWKGRRNLRIFRNLYYDNESKICPGLMGSYDFVVENRTEHRYNYKINFTEENPYNINMVFKLKKYGHYIKGNEDEWVDCESLSKSGLYLDALVSEFFTLEWKWEDTDYDTPIGNNPDSYYKIFLNVKTEQILE